MTKRTPLIAGNWKMNLSHQDSCHLFDAVSDYAKTCASKVDVAVAPGFLSLQLLGETKSSSIGLWAQNMCHNSKGAFTGDISVLQLKDIKCQGVLIGHSERRHVFGEQDHELELKVQLAITHGLTPILCVGETLEQRDAKQTEHIVIQQLESALLSSKDALEKAPFCVAYEPVWAIGTGRTPTPDDANKVHISIRAWLESHISNDVAQKTRILYGGSVKPTNAKPLMQMSDIDGALVGGASLKAESFIEIIAAASHS